MPAVMVDCQTPVRRTDVKLTHYQTTCCKFGRRNCRQQPALIRVRGRKRLEHQSPSIQEGPWGPAIEQLLIVEGRPDRLVAIAIGSAFTGRRGPGLCNNTAIPPFNGE